MSSTPLKQALSPLQLRDELEAMVLKELLGPGSTEEELTESPGTRYFVGVLAPRKRANRGGGHDGVPGGGPAAVRRDVDPAAGDDEVDVDDGEILDGDELALGGRDTSQDGTTDQSAAQEHAKALIPSSFGMTFSVNLEATEIDVSAAWGQYLREKSEYLVSEKTGNPRLVWKRYPRGGKHRLEIKEGPVPPIVVDHNCPEVVMQGLVRKRADHWCITLFLVNDQQEPEKRKDTGWIFQPELMAEGVDGAAVLHKRHTILELSGTDPAVKAENDLLAMLYRRHVEFAVGHGVGVDVDVSPDPAHAIRVCTKVVPIYEVPKTTPPRPDDAESNPAFAKLEGLVLDMKLLAETNPKQYRAKLKPLVEAYQDWIEREEKRIADPAEGLTPFKQVAQQTIARCRNTLKRIEEGLDLLDKDEKAAQAFQFMNRAMWLQRTHSIFAERVRRTNNKEDYNAFDIAENRSWYPFQLAFILLNLPGITKFDHPERSESPDAIADLLWFPTGGGKTEAYLGLTAYTLGLRRLQGIIEGRSGENGVTVLMRYTLRLLTLQQFQRAAALICACEDIRRTAMSNGDNRWGKTPFRIGLWVGGSTTPNWTSDADEAVKSARSPRRTGSIGGVGSPHQLTNCPYCGSKIEMGSNLNYRVEKYADGACRTLIYCLPISGQCKFSMKEAPGEGLPVMVVDEEIYRRLPSLLITTVDKFAQLPWNGSVQMLFGQVDGLCERHGFRSPGLAEASAELEINGVHRAKGNAPSAKVLPQNPLRPPDLIIQDELHLISGPLGTLVGLYETAIDRLCTWEVGGKKVRPKVVASTATIRRASDQVYGLFLRNLNIFPPNGTDIGDNFFSLQRKSNEKTPGRKYIGICAPGRRLKAALIRVYVAFLSAGQKLFNDHPDHADPWMTLVGYFNSLRELGGMKRLVDDDVRTRLRKMQDRGLANRTLYTPDTVKELTSRLGSTAIPETLDLLESRFDPAILEDIKKRKSGAEFVHRPLDVLLATNMISVGVDVPRLGLMVVGGQPKTTAEYIQATSRVGRKFPGLVCTVFNWARPRDLSHYETFEHYHATFYKHVEALSVTPFSAGATARGLAALLVSLVRQSGFEFNSNDKAMLMATQRGHHYVTEAIEAITRRAELVAGPETAEEVRQQLKSKMDKWQKRAQRMAQGNQLGYETKKDGVTVGLLRKPSIEHWDEFTCLNSLRDVEPTANLILDTFGMDDEGDDDDEGVAE